MDGNMLSNGVQSFAYDSANQLIKADGHTYTYNAEDVRIRNLCSDADTTYTYNTNCKLSQLLTKTTNGITTKYVYGHGLIGEEKEGCFKTYHFDYRGSTIAITDINGNITDTFKYDTYGKMIEHIGNSFVIFGYNGRDGVITDRNGLIYMRARYYSPEMRRFINADILHGEISDSTTLNRYSYVNGNPVSYVDPFGLSKERGQGPSPLEAAYMANNIYDIFSEYIKSGKTLDGYNAKNVGDWTFMNDLYVGNENGLFIVVYKRENSDGSIDYTVVNKGSKTTNDWINNLLQPFGLSNDMSESIKFAKEFVQDNPNANITFVGHSKGGAEALANAKATNRDAIVFNPAIPNYEFYGLGDTIYTAKATSYVVVGEMLSSVYIAAEGIALSPYTPMTPWLLDDTIALASRFVFNSLPFWDTVPVPNLNWSPIDDHGFSDIYDYLEKHPEK